MLIFGQRHLRTILAECEVHHNGRRPTAAARSGLHGPTILSPTSPRSERIKRRPVLGGLVNEYERTA